nr:class II glutamine amidotransferase [bacterium]
MCGIMGYIGEKKAVEILIGGLQRMEYRGYDSAGIALLQDRSELHFKKIKGKVLDLKNSLKNTELNGSVGIAHTRWATHGIPNETNAHPHMDCKNEIAVVHNGIVENNRTLRKELLNAGHVFTTDTDTEVIAHLIEELYNGSLENAVQNALKELVGAFGIAVLSSKDPEKIIVARRGSPLVVGIGKNEYFVASDPSAIVEHTKDLVFLDDDEMAVLTPNKMDTLNCDNQHISKKVERFEVELEAIE